MEDIYQYTLETILSYSDTMRKKVVSQLISNGIATKKNEEEKISIKNILEKDRISFCLENDTENTIKQIEIWEFKKFYKYSIYYSVGDEDELNSLIEKAIEQGKVIRYEDISEFEVLRTSILLPSYICEKSKTFLKFNIKLQAIDNKGKPHFRRYPIVVCIYKNMGIIEMNFDGIEGIFGEDKMKYVHDIEKWFDTCIKKLQYYNLAKKLEIMRKEGFDTNLCVVELCMKLSSGAVASLGIGKRSKTTLPFLGDFKEIIARHRELLESVAEPFLLDIEQYIKECEEQADLPSTIYRFLQRKIDVKFVENYDGNSGMYLVQHYATQTQHNMDRGRLEYVAEYVANVKESSNGKSK